MKKMPIGRRIKIKGKSYMAKTISKNYKKLLKPYGLKVPK